MTLQTFGGNAYFIKVHFSKSVFYFVYITDFCDQLISRSEFNLLMDLKFTVTANTK